MSHARSFIVHALAGLLTLAACSSTPRTDDPPSGLVGGEWRLVTMQGNPVADDAGVTLLFGDDQQISGRGFVNQYFGSYTRGEGSAISIGTMGMSMMAGPEPIMDNETAYLALLSQINRYEVSDESLVLKRDGEPLLGFGRMR
jgi:heat shock protein HslJ